MKFGSNCGKYAFPVHKDSILAKAGLVEIFVSQI
jgi:hypothetical protein